MLTVCFTTTTDKISIIGIISRSSGLMELIFFLFFLHYYFFVRFNYILNIHINLIFTQNFSEIFRSSPKFFVDFRGPPKFSENF